MMKQWSGQIFPIILLSLLAALSFWLERMVDIPDPRRDGKTRHDPDAIIENFHVRRMDVDGTLKYRLTAPHLMHFADDDSSLLRAPLLTYYRPDAPDMTLSGKNAYSSAKGEVILLWDDVVATRAPTPEKAAMVARMPFLTIEPEAGTAFTDSPVEITQGPSWAKGVGMTLDNNTSIMVLQSQVTGLYYPPRTQAQ